LRCSADLVVQNRKTLTFVIPTEHSDSLCESEAQGGTCFSAVPTGLGLAFCPIPGLPSWAKLVRPFGLLLTRLQHPVFLMAEG
jgi:hypothetical protein